MLGENLRSLRKSKKLTLQSLADLLNSNYPNTFNFNKGRISKWENNIDEPSLATARILADFFKVSIDELYYGIKNLNSRPTLTLINDTSAKLEEPKQKEVLIFAENKLQEQKQKQKQKQGNVILANFGVKYNVEENKKVDIAGKVAAGYGSYNPDKTQPIKTITMNAKDVPYGYDLAFEVSGDSMYPTFEDDEIIFVKKTTEVTNGMIGCVEINGDAFIKKMYIEDGRLRLVSLNNDYDENGNRIYPNFYADDNDEIFIIGKVVM